MRMGTWGKPLQGHTGRIRPKSRLKGDRKARITLIELEGLELRTLLATIPAAAATGSAVNLTGFPNATSCDNANNPMVVVDPFDSQKVFAVWGVDLSQEVPVPTPTTAVVQGAYSSDGGTSWNNLFDSVNRPILDVATITSTNPTDYAQVTDPSVAFDGKGDVYVLALQTTGANDGALTMTEFNFSGGTPVQVSLPNNGIIYQWVSGSDGVTTPILAVDQALPDSTDPHANNVYIAWASTDTEPADTRPYTGPGFNPNRAELVVGTPIANPSGNEQSLAFSAATTVNVSSGRAPQDVNFGPAQQSTHPQLVINQNATGQVTVAWDDAGTGAKASPPFDLLDSNLVQAGNTYGFRGATGPYAPAIAGASRCAEHPGDDALQHPGQRPRRGGDQQPHRHVGPGRPAERPESEHRPGRPQRRRLDHAGAEPEQCRRHGQHQSGPSKRQRRRGIRFHDRCHGYIRAERRDNLRRQCHPEHLRLHDHRDEWE